MADQYEENITQEWIEKIRYEKNYFYDSKLVDDIRLKLRNVQTETFESLSCIVIHLFQATLTGEIFQTFFQDINMATDPSR